MFCDAMATLLINQAVSHKSQGNLKQAKQKYLEAFDAIVNQPRKNNLLLSSTLIELTLLHMEENPHVAMDFMRQAIASTSQYLGGVLSFAYESQVSQWSTQLRQELDLFLSLVVRHFTDNQQACRETADLVFRRKAIETEVLFIRNQIAHKNDKGDFKPLLKSLMAVRDALAANTIGPYRQGDGSEIRNRMDVIEFLKKQKELLETQLGRKAFQNKNQLNVSEVERSEIVKCLPENSALIEFVRYSMKCTATQKEPQEKICDSEQYLAIVLLSDECNNVYLEPLGDANQIDKLVNAFRTSTTNHIEKKFNLPGSSNLFNQNGEALRSVVFDPLARHLKDRKRLFISPDGELTKVPFETLPTTTKHHMIDEYLISYLTTARSVLRWKNSSSSPSGSPLVIADPSYDLTDETNDLEQNDDFIQYSSKSDCDLFEDFVFDFYPLPSTSIEGNMVADLLGVKPKLRDKATKGCLWDCHSPSILHIATHGFYIKDKKSRTINMVQDGTLGGWFAAQAVKQLFNPGWENPMMRSGLALAGANNPGCDNEMEKEIGNGLLTAEEAAGLNLVNTELVVLSACETGLGDIRMGETVFGLRRAFEIAGAKTLIMSLWKVADEPTQELMKEFYKRILAGESRVHALRNAQLELKSRWPSPRHWGAFICQGEPGELHSAFEDG